MRITVLADNTAAARGVLGEHGLALWIDTGAHRVLFDTGSGMVLARNARTLNINIGEADAIVLSHGHDDHTGGLADALALAGRPVDVVCHPDALQPRYRRTDSGARDIGMPAACREAVRNGSCRLIHSIRPTLVAPGIWSTGEIPRRHPEEAVETPFVRDPDGREPDPFADDQALVLDTPGGPVVLLGCAHAGVINTLDRIRDLAGGGSVRALVGGMHLGVASDDRLRWTIRELRRFDIRLIAPLHCTGGPAVGAIRAELPDVFLPAGAGTVLDV